MELLLKSGAPVFSGIIALLCFLFTFPANGLAAQAGVTDGEKVSSSSQETIQDLGIFWDEKDLYVETPTHNSKRISQVAENVTVITAKEIEDMNAHTVSEVLDRVPGLFVEFQGRDFGSPALYSIQGSAERHVLVLVDGTLTLNFLSNGSAETNSIPVQIIDRIEIIEGPGSSVWGSSLGGVINIITKRTGTTARPSGSISASYGEANSQDYNGEVFGKLGPIGYYLYGGRQQSDGLTGRDYERNSFYSKFRVPTTEDSNLSISVGYSDPKFDFGDLRTTDLSSTGLLRNFHTYGSFDTQITNSLSFALNAFYMKQKFTQDNDVLGVGLFGNAGDNFLETDYDEQTMGAKARFFLTEGIHNAVFGVDATHGELDEKIEAGSFPQLYYGVPAELFFSPQIDSYAIYSNDTMSFGNFSVTPGLRFDHNSVTGSFVSPSLGMTYRLSKKMIARAQVARGFGSPPLSWTSGGALFLNPNPSLDAEEVWSYQAGLETNITDYIWVKATLFRYDLDNAIVSEQADSSSSNNIYVNNGDVTRQGVELISETMPFHNFSLKTGFSYVNIDSSSKDVQDADMYKAVFALKYDDRHSWMAQIYGNYTWWNRKEPNAFAEYDGVIVDVNVIKKLYATNMLRLDLFATGHNIFDGSQYTFVDWKNPGPWFEAGLRLKF